MIQVKKEVVTKFRYKAGVYLSEKEFQIILHALAVFRDSDGPKKWFKDIDVQQLLDDWSDVSEQARKAIKAEKEEEAKQMPPTGEHDSQSKPPSNEELLRTGDQCKSTTGNCE